jgi:membrane-bound serine protease (ClpP class)
MSGNDGRHILPVTWRIAALLSIALGLLLGAVSPLIAQSSTPRVETIEIDGTITPVMAQHVDRGIRRAENRDLDAIVLLIDTPGGLSSAMDDIIRSILESDVPVIAYVTPRGAHAASAGVYIAYAAHVSAMAPGTNIGSASPVAMGGEMDETMTRKVTNDAVAKIRNLADFRGRNADWAEDAVRNAVNITADEALSLGVIDLMAPDLETLLNDANGRQVEMANGQVATLATAGASIDAFRMNVIESTLQFIAEPTIAYLLISLGALGIFLELSHPGGLIPGIVGALAVIFGLFGLGTVPVDWTGALLIAVGLALFFIDIFVSSFGLLLVGGLTCFIVGSYMLVDTSVPGYDGVSRPVIWAAAACVVGSAAFIGYSLLKIRRLKPATGSQGLIGDIGVVREELAPSGWIFVTGERWHATLADGSVDRLPVGARVEVIALDGLHLTVRPAPENASLTGRDILEPRNAGIIPVSHSH